MTRLGPLHCKYQRFLVADFSSRLTTEGLLQIGYRLLFAAHHAVDPHRSIFQLAVEGLFDQSRVVGQNHQIGTSLTTSVSISRTL